MPKKIMIVEDSPTQALKLQLALEEEGFEASCFHSAEEALEALNNFRPDLMMVDYHLPGILGDDLCRRVRMNVNTQGIPILMLTMNEDLSAQLRGLESGADDYVTKTEDPEILMLRAHSLMRKSNRQTSIIKTEDMFFRKAHVLIIDDSPTYLKHLSSELEDDGYQVDTAPTAEEGLALCQKHDYDCILVDLVLPKLDGIEVCKRLNSADGDSTIIILLISAHETKENTMNALEAGAHDFIGKSGDISVLKARIRALLRHKFLHDQTRKLVAKFKKREDDLERLVAERTKELKRAEVRAQEARGLAEDANRAKTQFLANMSHELRTPLNAIIGYSDMIIHEILGPLGSQGTDKYKNYIKDINDSGQLLLEIINDILDLSSIEVGKVNLHEENISIKDIINSAWRLVKQPAEKGLVKITTKLDQNLPLLFADQRLIKQTVLNILTNAVKFTPEKGRVTIMVSLEKTGAMVIRITDTGIGIAKKDLEKVMSPFGQVDGEFSRKHSGTGLGLPLAQTFTNLHGGTLELQSEVKKGTTVTLRFPPERVR